jgi:alkanesulfonate monooxygenase SsuD/methylene tetrahydromethanopterin reductase-like flavin-dependent oxidoreductase (luciferase family)
VRHAINLPLFGPLADPAAIVEIGQAADENGWEGLCVWDHVLSRLPEAWEISDPWVVLAALAVTTERIRLGPMVTPWLADASSSWPGKRSRWIALAQDD